MHGELGILLVHSGPARISIRNGQPPRCANYTDSPAWIRWQSSCTTVAHVARENVHPSKRCRRSRARPDPSPRAGRRLSPELGTQGTGEPSSTDDVAGAGRIRPERHTRRASRRLRGEERDTSERVIDYRIAPVRGYIAPFRRTNFCSTAMAAATRYPVTVLEAPAMGDR
jgi:hypothetical protein